MIRPSQERSFLERLARQHGAADAEKQKCPACEWGTIVTRRGLGRSKTERCKECEGTGVRAVGPSVGSEPLEPAVRRINEGGDKL